MPLTTVGVLHDRLPVMSSTTESRLFEHVLASHYAPIPVAPFLFFLEDKSLKTWLSNRNTIHLGSSMEFMPRYLP